MDAKPTQELGFFVCVQSVRLGHTIMYKCQNGDRLKCHLYQTTKNTIPRTTKLLSKAANSAALDLKIPAARNNLT